MNALVADIGGNVGLAVARSLGKGGINVVAASANEKAYTLHSKYVKKRIIYSKSEDEHIYVEKLLNLVETHEFDVFIPILHENVLRELSKRKKEFERCCKLPIADFDSFDKADNKAETLKIAIENGSSTMKFYTPRSSDEIDAFSKELDFPVVIKPCRDFGARGFSYAYNTNELKQKFDNIQQSFGPPIIQEFIPGIKYSMSAILNRKSQPRGAFVHRALREYPITGGPVHFGVSVDYPELMELGLKILKAIRYSGIAQVEFILDERDNTLRFMEINPRLYGTIQIAIASGVDYPYLLYKMAVEEDIEENFNYKIGVKCRNVIFGDTKHLLSVLKGGKSPKYKIGKFRTLVNYLKFYEDDAYYIESFDDPLPVLIKIKEKLISQIS